jgi:ribonuclease HII
MPCILAGIDEAGYGPNLGPFVMSAVSCRLTKEEDSLDLWQRLASAVRKGKDKRDKRDSRLLVDDSKIVHAGVKGLARLEQGVLCVTPTASTFAELLQLIAAEFLADLQAEPWFKGSAIVPLAAKAEDVQQQQTTFRAACVEAGIEGWQVRSVILCPTRFNAVVSRCDNKSAVVAVGFARLLELLDDLEGTEKLLLFSDKQGGRNTYAGQIQQAIRTGMVRTLTESNEQSRYQVVEGLREMELTFLPKADGEHFCVALASMVSKYIREACMSDFNHFWQQLKPDLKATAGYPVDALRFMAEIEPLATEQGIAREKLWRER